jgi:peptidoglycan LD-endopeptidase LytH
MFRMTAGPMKTPFRLALTILLLGACTRTPPVVGPEPADIGGVRSTPRNRDRGPAVRMPPRPEYRDALESGVEETDLDALWVRRLMVPVHGFTREGLRDTYTAPRTGDRNHRAIDLLSPAGTPVIAADDQVIGRLGDTPLGGIIIYASDLAQQFVYYYAHLQSYRSGLAVGDTVARGDVIGYVGSTGNASPAQPHLHFQVMKRGAGRAWWEGPPINPYLFFAFDGRKK